ncbi:diguanylate cyclase (GGDEF)-like protein [Oxalobacteraceae bacterium GrIS 2.11]
MAATSACPIPDNEVQRLDALRSYEILDSEPELEFDALARAAAFTFNTPIALVAMMDSNRLWFKSKIGLDILQLDRKVAFCAYTINSPIEPLIVPDLSSDIRFAKNPLVAQAPNLRFYAGAPLLDANGLALGTITVIDAKPRSFSDKEAAALKDFATLAMLAMNARKRAIDLRKLALTDYLTDIPNRAQFDLSNAIEMSNFIRTNVPYSVIAMDLNGFKSVNDSHGHNGGDQVLRIVAGRLSKQLRVGDVIARLGGDEFGVVARNCDRKTAETMAQRFAKSLEQPIQLSNGALVKVGISCGISTASELYTSAELLLHRADDDLYKSKINALKNSVS